jgi:hypothetical protein
MNLEKSRFQVTKFRKWTHRDLYALEICFSGLGRMRVYRPSKCWKRTHKNLSPLELWVSLIGSFAFTNHTIARNEFKNTEVSLNCGFHKSAEVAFSDLEIQKMNS